MHADEVRSMFDYSYAATARILAAAAGLNQEQYVERPPLRGSGSIQNILVHMLDAEHGWRENLRARRRHASPELDEADFPTVATLIDAWQDDEQHMREWLTTLDDDAVNSDAFNDRKLWQCLLHLVNHSTQHRSEAAMLLTHFGHSPGDLDLSYFLRGWADA